MWRTAFDGSTLEKTGVCGWFVLYLERAEGERVGCVAARGVRASGSFYCVGSLNVEKVTAKYSNRESQGTEELCSVIG